MPLLRKLAITALFSAALSTPAFAAEQSQPSKRVAITFDDLPFVAEHISMEGMQAETRKLLAALKKHHAPAIGFVNEDKLLADGEVAERIGLLKDWLDAGMELGNHNYGHVGFHGTALKDYEEAALRGDTVTRWLLAQQGKVPRYYRHPYLQTGDTAEDKAQFEEFLKQHGYRVAPVTMEHDDFQFATVYDDDLFKRNAEEAQRIRAAYDANLGKALPVFETMSEELFGRQIPQVMLIHASQLNADTLDATLTHFEQQGYRFITLDEALADPAYQMPDKVSGRFGPVWLARWARAAGKKLSVYGQADPEDWIVKREQEIEPQTK